MRLLFLSNVHPNPLAPTKGTFNGALVRALAAQHDVHVVCPISWIDRLRAPRVAIPNQPILLQPTVTASYPTFWYPPKIFRAYYDRCLHWSIHQRLENEIRSTQPDAILSYWAHPDGAVALRLARQFDIPAITMVGGSDVLLLGRWGKRRQVILNTLKQSDAVIAVSEDIAMQIVADGVRASRVHVVRRGVDREIFHPGSQADARHKLGLPLKPKLIVGIGRLVPVKDWPTLISACTILNHNGKAPICCIVGDGPLYGALRQQIEQSNLQCQILLQGGQPQQALADWYRAADLVVLPSLSEGVPNVLLEAIACGTPFVATRVGGVPEIADVFHHRLVAPQEPKELADAILDRLHCETPAQRPRVHPLSWKESAEQVAAIIRGCRSTRRRRPPTTSLLEPTTTVLPPATPASESREPELGPVILAHSSGGSTP